MGMRIDREGNGYRIRLSGDRQRIIARDSFEIAAAVRHYYGQAHAPDLPHESCPLCRAIEEQERQARRQGRHHKGGIDVPD